MLCYPTQLFSRHNRNTPNSELLSVHMQGPPGRPGLWAPGTPRCQIRQCLLDSLRVHLEKSTTFFFLRVDCSSKVTRTCRWDVKHSEWNINFNWENINSVWEEQRLICICLTWIFLGLFFSSPPNYLDTTTRYFTSRDRESDEGGEKMTGLCKWQQYKRNSFSVI